MVTSIDDRKLLFYYLMTLILVECILTDDQIKVDNGKVIKKTYYYNDRLSYECDDDYEKEDVICQADETWSKTPSCVSSKG